MSKQIITKLIAVVALIVLLPSCRPRCEPNTVLDATEIQEIKRHLTCQAKVRGKVLNTHVAKKEGVVFLNLGNKDYRRAFSIVIFEDALKKFKQAGIDSPAEFYHNKNIVVIGSISEYKGRPQIIVDNPGQIEFK